MLRYASVMTRDVRSRAALVRLTAGFCCIFAAFQPLQALQSSLNAKHAVGTWSLGIIYSTGSLTGFVAPRVVRTLGTRQGLTSEPYWVNDFGCRIK